MSLFRRRRKDQISRLFQIKKKKKVKLKRKVKKVVALERGLSKGGFDLNWYISSILLLAGIASLVFLSVYIGMFLRPIFVFVIWIWLFCAVLIFVYWNKQLHAEAYSLEKLAKVISFYIAVTMITQLVFLPMSLKVVSGLHGSEMSLLKVFGVGLFFAVNWGVNLFIFYSFVSAYYVKVKFLEIFTLHALMILISVISFGFLY